jgi:hypothetical protein
MNRNGEFVSREMIDHGRDEYVRGELTDKDQYEQFKETAREFGVDGKESCDRFENVPPKVTFSRKA